MHDALSNPTLTAASQRALSGLRDFSMLQWYVIPLLAVLFYVYATEAQKARRSGDWAPVLAGLTLFGMDFVNESVNGWILALSGRSALWTAPGPTALRTMVGWNLEIMFMFAISGIIYHHSLSDDPQQRQPDISLAQAELGWQPVTPLREGLLKTIAYFDRMIADGLA